MDLLGLALPGSPFVPVTADPSGNWSVTDSRALLPGAYTLVPTETTPASSFTGSVFALTVDYSRGSAASAAALLLDRHGRPQRHARPACELDAFIR